MYFCCFLLDARRGRVLFSFGTHDAHDTHNPRTQVLMSVGNLVMSLLLSRMQLVMPIMWLAPSKLRFPLILGIVGGALAGIL